MQKSQVQSLGQEDPLEKEMVTHSSILAWRVPWTGIYLGTFHAKMGSIKNRNGMDLTEALDIKWCQEHTELYKKDPHDPDNHEGMITHLETDILEWEVKRALGSIITNKASGGDGIEVELFQILKDDAVKVLHSICQQIRKTQQWPQDCKSSVFTPILKKGNAKECSNYHTNCTHLTR